MATPHAHPYFRKTSRLGWLVSSLALAACQFAPIATPQSKPVERALVASPAATPLALAPQTLQAPKGASRVLAGTIAVDASYIVASGGGNVVKLNGQSVIAGAGQVISNDGGTLLSKEGGALLARGTGNVISNDGGTLITNDGGSVISNDGGTLYADDGTSFLARGSGIIAQGGGNAVAGKVYGLAATGTPAVPAVGTRLPAAGILVSVVSLATHKYLPVGVDGAGKPVYAVYSNARGQYTLYLATADASNVVVVASARDTSDHRRAYNLLASGNEDRTQTLDEASSIACKFLRRALVNQMKAYTDDPVYGASRRCNEPVQESVLKDLLGSFLADVTAASQAAKAGPTTATSDDRNMQKAADYLFGCVTLGELRTQPGVVSLQLPNAKPLPSELVVTTIADVLDRLTQAAATQLAKDPNFFTCGQGPQALQAFCDKVAAQNKVGAHHGQVPPLAATTPADFGEYVLGTLLPQPSGGYAGDSPALLEFAGVPDSQTQIARLAAAGFGSQLALIDCFKNGNATHSASQVQNEFLDLVSGGQPRKPGLPPPTPPANCPSTPKP
jgi:hypothetical protein